MLFDKTAFVSALDSNNPSTDQESFTLTGASIRLNIQPASAELTAMADGEMFKTYRAFTTSSGVTEGMTLTVSGTGALYRVRGREVFDYGMGQHYELTLVKSDVRS